LRNAKDKRVASVVWKKVIVYIGNSPKILVQTSTIRLISGRSPQFNRFLRFSVVVLAPRAELRYNLVHSRPDTCKQVWFENLSANAQVSLRTMRCIIAILIQASLVRGLIS